MALKAGRVGVNPSQVDMAGNVIGGSSDTYTKLEIDQMLGSKVGIGQLEANNKDFYFAYDATTQKYGYKLDNTGDFHPFEEGGSGGIGWVKPPVLSHDTLVFPEGSAYIDGGYFLDTDNNICYVDLICSKLGGSGGVTVSGFPSGKTAKLFAYRSSSELSSDDAYFNDYSSIDAFEKNTSGELALASWSALGYMRVIGMYPLT